MVRCIVSGCKWSKKKVEKTMPTLYRFPKNREMFDLWAVKIGKDIPKDPRICKEHFEEDQFEVDLKVRFTYVLLYLTKVLCLNVWNFLKS